MRGTELNRRKRKLAKLKISSLCPLIHVFVVGRRQSKSLGEWRIRGSRYEADCWSIRQGKLNTCVKFLILFNLAFVGLHRDETWYYWEAGRERKFFLVIFDKAAEEARSGMCNFRPISEVVLGPRKPSAGRKTFRMHNNLWPRMGISRTPNV